MNDGRHLTSAIRPGQTIRLISCAPRALLLGCPLNQFVTIHCEAAGIEEDRVHGFLTRIMKLAADWLRECAGIRAHYVYAFENPSSGGLHVHILVHVPPAKQKLFGRRLRGWLRAAGATNRGKVLDIQPIGRSGTYDPSYLRALAGMMKYIMKGAKPAACAGFGIVHKPQGRVTGKRVGSSQTLSPKAMRSAPELPPALGKIWSELMGEDLVRASTQREPCLDGCPGAPHSVVHIEATTCDTNVSVA